MTRFLKGTDRPLAEAYQLALLDLDGVVYRGKNPVEYAADSIRAAEAAGMNLRRASAHSLGITLDDGTALVQGRRVTGFSTAEEDGYARADVPFDLESALREEGALYVAGADWQPHVVVDGTLITGQNPASAGPLAHALVAALQVQA